MKILKKIKFINSFTRGFFSVFQALTFVKDKKGLKKFLVFPFIINVFILSAVFYLSYFFIYPWLSGLLPTVHSQGILKFLLSGVRFILKPLLFILLSFIVSFIYSIVGGIITAPFNDLASNKTEEILTEKKNSEKFNIKVFLNDITRTLANIVKMLILLIGLNIIILFFNFIPIAGNFVYSFLSFFIGMFFLGFQFYDFSFERARLSFSEKLKISLKQPLTVVGLGTSFYLISLVPVLGFLALTIGAVAGTTIFVEDIKPKLMIEENSDR